MTKIEWMYVDFWSKKIKAINLLGGKCSKCGNDNIFVLSFHHFDSKTFAVSQNLNGRWSSIEKEIKKCILLCENCHKEEHFFIGTDGKSQGNKKVLLDYKNIYECSKCSYDKYTNALEFHHIKPDDKIFGLATISTRLKNVYELEEYIKEELDKCEVLCSNCHREESIDKIKFDKYKDLIYNNQVNEQLPSIKPEIIKEMLDSGMNGCQIAKELGRNKSTIYTIIKKHNL